MGPTPPRHRPHASDVGAGWAPAPRQDRQLEGGFRGGRGVAKELIGTLLGESQ